MNNVVAQFATLPAIALPDTALVMTLSPQQIGFVEDSTNLIKVENLDQQTLTPLVFKNTQQINQSGFNYWAVIKIANPKVSPTTWWLEVPGNEVNAWVEHSNRHVETFRTGNLLQQNEKAISGLFRNFNYIPLVLAPQETLVVKLQIKTGTFFPIYFGTFKLGEPIYFENWQHQRFGNTSFINGLFGALMIACCVYCLVYFILTKELFAVGILIYCLCLLGYSYQFNSTWYRLGLSPVFIQVFGVVMINLSIAIHCFFIRNFLNLKQLLPTYDTVFKYCSYFLFAFTVLHALFYWLGGNYLLSILGILLIHSLFYLPSLIVSIKLIRVRERGIQILAIGVLISHSIWLFNNAQLFNLSNDLLKIGGMIYVLSILVSLSFRAAEAQRQRIQTKAERLLNQVKLQELQKLDGLKSAFFANISHELRTPLTLIMSPIQSAIKSGTLNNRNFTLLKKAEQSSIDLLKLINSILDLTKLEAGKLQLTPAAVPLYPLLQRILSGFESLAQEKQIQLIFTYQLPETLVVELDKEKFIVILNNLLANACKFTPANGRIELQVKHKSSQIEFQLTDDGSGIHPEDLPHIFNRFYQSKQENMPVQGGTGIGLALTQEYVQLMGGHIQVNSELGVGTTFTMRLPHHEVLGVINDLDVENTTVPIASPSELNPTLTGSTSILVVEDNFAMRDYLNMILSTHYQVVTAENGQVGWEQLQQSDRQIQLVISDLMMPVVDGYQLLAKIKSDDQLRHLPCLMLTARADLQDKLKALRIGVDDYVLKPFVEEELLVRIHNLLQNRANRVVEPTAADSTATHPPQISEEDQNWLTQFETTLQQQIDNPDYSVANMVDDFSISESTLNRQLKRLTGLTPARYLREIRLNEARQLLENRKFNTIRQVTYAVGFKDIASFSRTYKKRFGKTPKETLLLLLFFMIGSLTMVSGQVANFDAKVDSIRLLLGKTQVEQEKIQLQINIAQLHADHAQLRTAIKLYQELLPQIEVTKYPNLFAQVHLNIGALFQNNQIFKLDSTDYHYNHVLPILEDINADLKLNAFFRISTLYYALDQFENATYYCVECIELAEKVENKHWLERCLKRMATYCAIELNDVEKAEAYTAKALKIVKEIGDINRLGKFYLSIANDYIILNQPLKALSFMDSSYVYAVKTGNEKLLTNLSFRQTNAYLMSGDFDRAYETGLRTLEMVDRDSIVTWMMQTRLLLGKIKLLKQDYAQVIPYAQAALNIFPERLTLHELSSSHAQLYEAYAGLEDYKSAFHHYTQWITYRDSIEQLSQVSVITELERKYDTSEKEKTIQLQQVEILRQRQQRRLIVGFMSILVALLGIMVGLWLKMRRSNQRIKAQNKIITKQSKTLKQLDKLKSNFFANISHELRTPLTLMLGPINSALQSGHLNNRNYTLLRKAQQGGQDLLKLVNSILDLSKMEANKMKLNAHPESLYPLIYRIVAAFESYAERKGILFQFNYQLERELQLLLDKEKVEVVLNNLLSNALKFTPKNGKVSVQIEALTNFIKITVTDTGRGIHPEDLPHVFNRFYQSQQPNAPTEGGTGIGLALSQEYVQLMQGTIAVESQLGAGSTFSFTIPRKEVLGIVHAETTPLATENESFAVLPKQFQTELLAPTKNTDAQSGSTILVVEDNASLRDYIATILSPYYQVLTAENGAVALEILHHQQPLPDLVISDIMMPMMDGYQLLTSIKNNDRLRHLPCIMLTARAAIQDKLKALRIGVDDYLLKPFLEAELLVRIDNLLQNRTNRGRDSVAKTTEKTSVPEFSQEEQTWLIEFEQTLQQQIANPNYAISDMVNDFAISESTLNRQLKKLTGLTPARYLREIRLSEARRLLENRQFKNINQVAYAVGFKDMTSFSRTYKKRFGKTPKEVLQL